MKTRLGGRTWAALLTFGLFGQIAWVIENMYFNVFLYNTISGDTSMIAAMVAWSAVTATVTTLVMGALSDRLGRRKALIVIGYLLWGVSIGAFAFIKRSPLAGAAHSAAVLVVVLDCVMTFFGSTANDAAFNAYVTDVTCKENRGRVESVLAVLPLLSMLVIFGAFDGMTQQGRWREFFLIFGALVSVVGLVSVFLLRESGGGAARGHYLSTLAYGFRPAVVRENGPLYLALSALGLFSIAVQVFFPYLIIYLQTYLQLEAYALVLGIVLIVASLVSVLSGRWIDRLGKLRCVPPALAVMFVGLVLMYVARSMAFVIVSGTVMMAGYMLVTAVLSATVRDYTPRDKAGSFQGIRMIFAVLLPMVIGPFLGAAVIRGGAGTYEELGVVKSVPTPDIFLAAAVVLLTVLLPVWLLRRRAEVRA